MEHLSILLEIIAFFFVTIDLYGRERLEKLRDKIIKIKIGRIHDRVKASVTFKVSSYFISLGILLLIVWYVRAIYSMFMSMLLITNVWMVNLVNIIILLAFIYLIFSLATCFYMYLKKGDTTMIQKLFLNNILRRLTGLILYFVDKVIYLNERLMYKVLVFILWLSNFASFDGIMLSIGASLFLVAKVLAYCAVDLK